MKSLKLWIGLLLLFLSGIAVGAAGTWILGERLALGYLTGNGHRLEKVIMKKLTRQLALDEGQKERIAAIISRTRAQLIELRKRYRPERERIIEQAAASVRNELAPQQRKKFDVLYEKAKERRALREDALEQNAAVEPRPGR